MLMQQHEDTVKTLQDTIKQLGEELIQAQSGANTSFELEILASRQKGKGTQDSNHSNSVCKILVKGL